MNRVNRRIHCSFAKRFIMLNSPHTLSEFSRSTRYTKLVIKNVIEQAFSMFSFSILVARGSSLIFIIGFVMRVAHAFPDSGIRLKQ